MDLPLAYDEDVRQDHLLSSARTNSLLVETSKDKVCYSGEQRRLSDNLDSTHIQLQKLPEDPNRHENFKEQKTTDLLLELIERKQSTDTKVPDIKHRECRRDPSSLYELLDNCEYGRKRMFQLLSNRPLNTKIWTKFRESAIENDCAMEIEKWYAQEPDTNSNMQVGMGNGPNINFAWSSSSPTTQSVRDKVGSDRHERNMTERSTITNEYLLNKAKKSAREIREKQRTSETVFNDSANPKGSHEVSMHAPPQFKMDPLETFVAQALPREKKKSNKHKHKSILWFWGSNEKKKAFRESDQGTSMLGHFRRTVGPPPGSLVQGKNTEIIEKDYKLDVVSDGNNSPSFSIPNIKNSNTEGGEKIPDSLIDVEILSNSGELQPGDSKQVPLSAFQPLRPKKQD